MQNLPCEICTVNIAIVGRWIGAILIQTQSRRMLSLYTLFSSHEAMNSDHNCIVSRHRILVHLGAYTLFYSDKVLYSSALYLYAYL